MFANFLTHNLHCALCARSSTVQCKATALYAEPRAPPEQWDGAQKLRTDQRALDARGKWQPKRWLEWLAPSHSVKRAHERRTHTRSAHTLARHCICARHRATASGEPLESQRPAQPHGVLVRLCRARPARTNTVARTTELA